MRHIAIIGSGPAACYLAEQLLRAAKDSRIDLIERLPTPFGLVRYGIAPDHQGTKGIARLLGRALADERVRFFGHVEVGAAVSLAELRQLYDAVVLATGAPLGRRLGVPGEDLPGVFGSDAFVGWYNSVPDHTAIDPGTVRSVAVIGNGNVAVDVVRVLAKAGAELDGSDLPPRVTSWLAQQPLRTIHMIGRRGPEHAKFTQAELSELGKLERTRPVVVDPAQLERARAAGSNPVLDTLAGFVQDARELPIQLQFHFGLRPAGFTGTDRLEALQLERQDGTVVELPAELAVTCIGYQVAAYSGLEPEGGRFANDGGRIDAGLYVIGWAGRGPSGTIPTNRADAKQLAARMAAEVQDQGRTAELPQLLAARDVRSVDYAAWQRLDGAEKARAPEGRCRYKFETTAEMLAALDE